MWRCAGQTPCNEVKTIRSNSSERSPRTTSTVFCFLSSSLDSSWLGQVFHLLSCLLQNQLSNYSGKRGQLTHFEHLVPLTMTLLVATVSSSKILSSMELRRCGYALLSTGGSSRKGWTFTAAREECKRSKCKKMRDYNEGKRGDRVSHLTPEDIPLTNIQ